MYLAAVRGRFKGTAAKYMPAHMTHWRCRTAGEHQSTKGTKHTRGGDRIGGGGGGGVTEDRERMGERIGIPGKEAEWVERDLGTRSSDTLIARHSLHRCLPHVCVSLRHSLPAPLACSDTRAPRRRGRAALP
jgi:hypothetical protein